MKYTFVDNVYSPEHKWLEKPKTFKDEHTWLQAFGFAVVFVTAAFYILTSNV